MIVEYHDVDMDVDVMCVVYHVSAFSSTALFEHAWDMRQVGLLWRAR